MNSEILEKRLNKLEKHYLALKDYSQAINKLVANIDIYDEVVFNTLLVEQKAVLEAYLKRFSALQDLLGSKIFPSLLDVAGIGVTAMSEVLSLIEKEGIIDSFDNWMALREARNELEHDYPEQLSQALINLKFCIDNFTTLEKYYFNCLAFATKYNVYEKHNATI
ncbi:MAG: hypothetical protein HFP77_01780 [Methylococcales symbiont of Iophon sp. n. MRB-2018]|nr:MAG: hypothetical protein HFP77_01780 [Methylococcales symbiont of Iophon sp. n. MRB-2018]KAF3980524.1 MAG: hypothetical protein HFP76_01645 [Methylococcales symbiont of Iophon sp. n. MRB-2018]